MLDFTKPSRLILYVFLLLITSAVKASEGNDNDSSTFVIVHGATGGGWDWREVSNHLVSEGNIAYRPTLSGLGERYHLTAETIAFQTHVDDVVNMIKFEQLDNVVLVGHSYGGMVITGVMNAIPERIKHAIFLDAAVPNHGMTAFDVFRSSLGQNKIEGGRVVFGWIDESLPFPRDVSHPVRTLTEPVSYNNPAAKEINVSYVAFVPEGSTRKQRAVDPSWGRAEERGWTIRTFDGDHTIYRQKPVEMALLLIEAIDDRNTAPVETD